MTALPNPVGKKMCGTKCPSLWLRFFALHLFASLLVPVSHAQTASLASLQQSYEKAVADKAIAPYLAAVAALNQKYSAAIDRLTTAATQSGDLDTALILREEKKLLLPEGALPEDTESLPTALKAARATYRQQVATLQAIRDTATQPLKDHFRSLLQNLLTQTTQAGKLDEALAIREKISSIETSLSKPTPAPDSPSQPSPAKSSSKLITAKSDGKTDPEAARLIIAWALANDAAVTTSLGIIGKEEKLKTPPSGKFSITEIKMAQGANFPWTALEGMGQLQRLILNHDVPLTAEQTRHFHNLASLRFLKVIAITEDGLQTLPFFPNLYDLELNYTDFDPLPTLHLLQERTNTIQTLTIFRLPSGEVADALFAKLSGWPSFKKLQGPTSITPTRAAHLAVHPKFTEMGLGTGARVLEGSLPLLKNLVSVGFNGTQPPAILREITQLPNVRRITLDLEKLSVADIPDFSPCKAVTEINLDNTPSPAAEVIAKCTGITGMKIFKLGHTQIEPATITTLLNFKNLEVLSLNDCTFTPEAFLALQQFKAIKSFKELNIKASGIPPADLKALQKALPKCTIRTQ